MYVHVCYMGNYSLALNVDPTGSKSIHIIHIVAPTKIVFEIYFSLSVLEKLFLKSDASLFFMVAVYPFLLWLTGSS